MKKLSALILVLLSVPLFFASAAQITVPSAPTSGYALISTTTGAYVSTSTPWFLTLTFGKATSTAATTTNLFATTASTTNLFGTVINGFGLATCNSASSALTWASGSFGCNSISGGSGAPFPFTSQTWGVSTTTTIGLFNGFLSNASSTINANLLINGNSTTTNATTTNFFSTTASSTNLFTTKLGIASSSPGFPLSVTGDGYVSANLYANNFYDLSVGGSTCIGETNGLLGTSNCVSSIASAASTLTVSSPTGNVNLELNLAHGNVWTVASSTFVGGVTTGTSTTTSATSTNFFATTASTTNLFTSIGNALALGDSTGKLTSYAGVTCTNQFLRILSATGAGTCATVGAADVSLANLTATDGTLTFSGTYTGATARTIGLNLGNANTWTALQTFSNANSLLATGSTTLQSFTGTNSTTTNATTTNFFATTASSTNLFVGTQLGIGSSSPVTALGIGVGKAITVSENNLATSTSMTIDWTAGNQQLIQKGTAGITLTFSNVNPGAKLNLIACNPGTTGGSFTFPTSPTVLWPGGTAPTQTTTAKKCDIYTFLATYATSTATTLILGGFNQNY